MHPSNVCLRQAYGKLTNRGPTEMRTHGDEDPRHVFLFATPRPEYRFRKNGTVCASIGRQKCSTRSTDLWSNVPVGFAGIRWAAYAGMVTDY